MSRRKKIFIGIFGTILILFLSVLGIGVKIYWDLATSMDKTYEAVDRTKTHKAGFEHNSPFSVLLLGIDTGDLGRIEQGRSDTVMLATVNSQYKKTTLVSLPRDTYVDIVGKDTRDKLNHAYAFGGIAMSMDTVEEFLAVPINHYISINMSGLKDLVDAVGGIQVNNNLTFSQDGHSFKIGKIDLNGEQALAYSRMRYEDPKGDYGRQNRQRKVTEGLIEKLVSLESIGHYQRILSAISENMKTDLSFDDMKKIAFDYRNAFSTVEQDQLQGEPFIKDNISYQHVEDQELSRIQTKLREQLNIRK